MDKKLLLKSNAVWVTWESQVRNRSMASVLDLPLLEVDHKGGRIKRYLMSMRDTWRFLREQRPQVVFHQNPSIVLALFMVMLKPLLRFKIVVDAHNAAIYPKEGKSKLFNWIAKQLNRRADLIIAHNSKTRAQVEAWQQDCVQLPDPLPTFDSPSSNDLSTPQVVYVCRWAEDEPYQEVLEAAKLLEDQGITFAITGRPPKSILEQTLASNVSLTGFISNEEYVDLLANAEVLLVLTKRDNSLNCGGYEALALERPCILSDSKTLIEFFGSSFNYTDNSPDDIAAKVVSALENQSAQQEQMKLAKQKYDAGYSEMLNQLLNRIFEKSLLKE